MLTLRSLLLTATVAIGLAACDSGSSSSGTDAAFSVAPEDEASRGASEDGRPGIDVVFTLTDAAGPNEVLAFTRNAQGALTPAGAFATQGTGSNGGLGAASDPVVLSPDGRTLYAVNRGSDDVSVFRVAGRRLVLREVVSAGGAGPISLAVSDHLVYVLNTGRGATPGSVVAFARARNGRLTAIAGGTAALPAGVAGPPQIGFDPAVRSAVVTDRPSNVIVVYPVGRDGRPGTPAVNASAGVTPFGFDFDRAGRLFISNANAPAGPVPNGSSVSAYRLRGTATTVVEAAVPTTETAACWLRTAGRFFYVTNTASNTITGFEIKRDGSVEILDAEGVTATTGPNPRDLNVSGRFLYTQSDGRLDGFAIARDGHLTSVGTVTVPATARGVATL